MLAQTSSFGKPFQVVVALGLFALAFQPSDVRAQNPVTFGGPSFDQALDVAVDEAGNTYVTGEFTGTVDFDPGSGISERTSSSEGSTFVASYDPAGTLRFVSTTSGDGNSWGNGIDVDETGNVFVTGRLVGMVDFDPGPGIEERGSERRTAAFVASYDATGALRYVIATGGEGFTTGNSIAVDGAGNTFVAGTFSGAVDFDPGPGTEERNSGGFFDFFVASYDGSGALRFVSATSGDVKSGAYGGDIAVDEAGNVYVTGTFFGFSVDFDPGPGTETRSSYDFQTDDGFVASYDGTGAFRFVIALHAQAGVGVFGRGITVDENGNTFVTGLFSETVDFDPGPGIEERSSPYGDGNSFYIASYNPSGSLRFVSAVLAVIDSIGNTIGDPNVSDLALDESGNTYVTGNFRGTVDFDPGVGTELRTSEGAYSRNVFVASYDGTGAFRFVSATSGESRSSGSAIALDEDNNLYVAGYFDGTVDFAPGSSVEERTSNGDTDAFMLKLNLDGTLPGETQDTAPPECELVSVTPGPPTTLRVRLRDGGSGLAAVRVLQSTNATVTLPDVDLGTTDELFATAEKLDEDQRATVVLEAEDLAGNTTTCDPVVTTLSAEVPETSALEQNYPNPFNPTTQIRFQLAEAADVRLSVYDVTGREVAVLVSDRMEAGSYEVAWEGRDASGRVLPSGVYLYRLEAGTFTAVRTMALVK